VALQDPVEHAQLRVPRLEVQDVGDERLCLRPLRLVALGFLGRDGDRYANTPETDLFRDRNKSSYLGGMLEMANQRLYPFWGHLTEALRTRWSSASSDGRSCTRPSPMPCRR
jgi:hypothetical protein